MPQPAAMTTVTGLAAVAAGEVIIVLAVAVNILISCDCVTLTIAGECSADETCAHKEWHCLTKWTHFVYCLLINCMNVVHCDIRMLYSSTKGELGRSVSLSAVSPILGLTCEFGY